MKLQRINLGNMVRYKNQANGYTHPRISLDKWYLMRLENGRFAAGQFTQQWFGLNFQGFYDAGKQFEPYGVNNSDITDLWEIVAPK